MFLTWDGALGLSIAVGLLLPFVIYVDFRKHGRIWIGESYWRNWWGSEAILAALLACCHLWQGDPCGIVDVIGGMALGMSVTFWYALLLEKCLRIIGAIENAPTP